MLPPASPEQSTALQNSEAADVLDTSQAGSKAIRGGAIRVAGFATATLMSVGSSALLFRHLGVVAGGHYLTIVSLVTLTGTLTDAGLSAIGVRELSTRDAAGARGLMRSLVGVRMSLSLVGVAIAFAFAAVVGYGETMVLGTLIAGTGVLLTVLQDTYTIPLIAKLRLGWVTTTDLLRQGLTVTGIVILVAAGASLLPFWAISIPAGLGAAGLAAWLIHRDVPLLPSFRFDQWRALLRDTLPFALATAVAAAYFRVGILIVSLVAPGRQTGYFGVPFRIIEVLIVVPQLLVGASFPIVARAARDDRTRLSYALGRIFDAAVILAVATALALAVGAPFIIRVIGGAKFAPSVPVLRTQGFALMASFIGALWGYTLLSLHRHRQILTASLVALVTTLVVTTTLCELDGARGAAIGTVVSEVVFALMLGLGVYRAGVRPDAHWRALPRVVLAGALGAGALLIPVANAVQMILALVIYALALIVLRAVPEEVTQELRLILRGRVA